MALSRDDVRLLEEYFVGDLASDEQEIFKERLLDREFKDEFEYYQSIRKTSKALGRAELKRTFTQWEHEASSASDSVYRGWRMVTKVAASILLLLGLGAFAWMYWPTKISNQTLFLTYQKTYPNLIDPLTKGESSDVLTISRSYETGDYDGAISKDASDSLQLFYQALAFLELGQMNSSKMWLDKIESQPDHRFREPAQWTLALINLYQNDLEKCGRILDVILDQRSHDFREVALQLKADLAKLK